MVSLFLLGVFQKDKLKMIVFDDADTVATTELIGKLMVASCQKVYVTSTSFEVDNAVEMKMLVDEQLLPHKIHHYYAKCPDNNDKIKFIKKLSAQLFQMKSDGKLIIFCNVINEIFSQITKF